MPTTPFWKVNNVTMPCPSTWSWGLQDVSMGESGRTDDALMWKNRISQKRKIQIGFSAVTDTDAHTILQAINPEYIDVTYFDPLDGQTVTRNFYVSDRTAPVKWWFDGKKIYESLSFDLIER